MVYTSFTYEAHEVSFGPFKLEFPDICFLVWHRFQLSLLEHGFQVHFCWN